VVGAYLQFFCGNTPPELVKYITQWCITSGPWAQPRGGSRTLQGRVSNPSQRGTGGRALKAPSGVASEEVAEHFCISYIKMVSFYAFPVIFIDTVLYKEGHLNQKSGCPDTMDLPLQPTCKGLLIMPQSPTETRKLYALQIIHLMSCVLLDLFELVSLVSDRFSREHATELDVCCFCQ